MTRFIRLAPLTLVVALTALPLRAQDLTPPPLPDAPADEGSGLIEEGARTLLRGLMEELDPAIRDLGALVTEYEPMLRELSALVGNIDDYQAPELLENGDILIRRKPDAPVAPDEPQPDPGTGEVEL